MIPELVRFIFGMLSQGDLFRVITVSRIFWKAAAPQLWHAIHRPQLEVLFPLGTDLSLNTVSHILDSAACLFGSCFRHARSKKTGTAANTMPHLSESSASSRKPTYRMCKPC